ncbi:MAG: sigma-70 family RNA polymerase sigma factor [Kiritimatiellae bacterium]|nr:sigma-70 family RNA polymerase sigma factor [Kiritimatiellia bacterium]
MGKAPEKQPPSEPDDRELIKRYRRGDITALEQLVFRYQRPLLGYLLNMTGNREEADDLFQEVWFRVVRKIRLYSHRNFCGWLLRIARNCLIDRIRRLRPETSLEQEPEHGRPLEEILADANRGPASQVAAEELGQKIARAIAMLPLEQKEVFLMRMEAGLRFKEIARIQGTSINTALARMQYALHKLREILKDDYRLFGDQENWKRT